MTRGLVVIAALAVATTGCIGQSQNPSGLSPDGRPSGPVVTAIREFSQALASGSVGRLKDLAASNDTASDAPSLVREYGNHPNKPVAYDQSISVAALAVEFRVACGRRTVSFWQDFQADGQRWAPVIGPMKSDGVASGPPPALPYPGYTPPPPAPTCA